MTHKYISDRQDVTTQCDEESQEKKVSKEQLENILSNKETIASEIKYSTMFEDPSITTKEAICQPKNSDISKHKKTSVINMTTQVHHEKYLIEHSEGSSL